MTKNEAKILLESLQKVRQRSFWRYLFGSVLTHAIRTNEPFNPIFLGKKNIALLLYSLWASLEIQIHKETKFRVEEKRVQ